MLLCWPSMTDPSEFTNFPEMHRPPDPTAQCGLPNWASEVSIIMQAFAQAAAPGQPSSHHNSSFWATTFRMVSSTHGPYSEYVVDISRASAAPWLPITNTEQLYVMAARPPVPSTVPSRAKVQLKRESAVSVAASPGVGSGSQVSSSARRSRERRLAFGSATMDLWGVQKIQKLEEGLTKEWKGINVSHIAGYRYLCFDHTNKTAQASPPSKIATLSKESLAVLINLVHADIDLDNGRLKRQISHHDADLEVYVRTKQNAWLVVRARGSSSMIYYFSCYRRKMDPTVSGC